MVRPCFFVGVSVCVLTLEAAPRIRGLPTDSFDFSVALLCVLGGILAVVLWSVGSRLSRRATRFWVLLCPACLGPRTRPSMRQGIERWMPFLRHYRCEDCSARFIRGAHPPHAYCPRCGEMGLEAIDVQAIRSSFRVTALRLLGYHFYRCPRCRLVFPETKPLRPAPRQSVHAATR